MLTQEIFYLIYMIITSRIYYFYLHRTDERSMEIVNLSIVRVTIQRRRSVHKLCFTFHIPSYYFLPEDRIENRTGDVAWVELLPCKLQALGFIPSTKKKKEKKRLRRLLESILKHELWIIKTDYTLEKDHTSKILYLHHLA